MEITALETHAHVPLIRHFNRGVLILARRGW
jgi:hypothetical protein